MNLLVFQRYAFLFKVNNHEYFRGCAFQPTTSSAYVGKEMPFISMSKEEVFFKNKTFTDFIESILREWYYFTTENAIRNGTCKVL